MVDSNREEDFGILHQCDVSTVSNDWTRLNGKERRTCPDIVPVWINSEIRGKSCKRQNVLLIHVRVVIR